MNWVIFRVCIILRKQRWFLGQGEFFSTSQKSRKSSFKIKFFRDTDGKFPQWRQWTTTTRGIVVILSVFMLFCCVMRPWIGFVSISTVNECLMLLLLNRKVLLFISSSKNFWNVSEIDSDWSIGCWTNRNDVWRIPIVLNLTFLVDIQFNFKSCGKRLAKMIFSWISLKSSKVVSFLQNMVWNFH